MRSKWFHLKKAAINLRSSGKSLREIEKTLMIPRSTLSGWLKNISLTEIQKTRLRKKWLDNLYKARLRAVIWHNKQKEIRLKEAESQALDILAKIDVNNKVIKELALAMLYLGEGFKDKHGTGMGSSDPLILRFFVNMLLTHFGINIGKIKYSLHLRADQNPEILKEYWSKELRLPLENFTSASIDIRTKGKSTYATYHGVCVIDCGNIALQRRLIYLSRRFCEKI